MSDKIVLSPEMVRAYKSSFEMFVRAHLDVAESGGQLVFDVEPGGQVAKVNTRRNLGKCNVGDWKKIKAQVEAEADTS